MAVSSPTLLFIRLIVCGTLAITVPSRVVSIVFLIISYLIGVLISLSLQLELVGMAILIVYMGAIAVFFLFIVMVLGGNATPRKLNTHTILATVGVSLVVILMCSLFTAPVVSISVLPVMVLPPFVTSPLPIGLYLYTTFASVFIGGGLLLLVAIVVVIAVVKLRGEGGVRAYQESVDQRLRVYTKRR